MNFSNFHIQIPKDGMANSIAFLLQHQQQLLKALWAFTGGRSKDIFSLISISHEWRGKEFSVNGFSILPAAQKTHKKLVNVKFFGFKPISTFYSEIRLKLGENFPHFFPLFFVLPSLFGFMQFIGAEIYLLSTAAQFSSFAFASFMNQRLYFQRL